MAIRIVKIKPRASLVKRVEKASETKRTKTRRAKRDKESGLRELWKNGEPIIDREADRCPLPEGHVHSWLLQTAAQRKPGQLGFKGKCIGDTRDDELDGCGEIRRFDGVLPNKPSEKTKADEREAKLQFSEERRANRQALLLERDAAREALIFLESKARDASLASFRTQDDYEVGMDRAAAYRRVGKLLREEYQLSNQ